ncbi:hypothetical protein HDZ31DRAFT_33889 [Schizophyllum fasciatum]
MRGRVETDRRGRTCADPLQYRAYLDIALPDHRKAVTQIVTGEHSLLEVRGGWAVRGLKIDRAWRKCRFCQDAIEDSVHALFLCIERADLVILRAGFWSDIADVDPLIRGCSPYPARWVHALCANRTTCARFGKFAFDVLQLYSLHRPFVPPAHGWVRA